MRKLAFHFSGERTLHFTEPVETLMPTTVAAGWSALARIESAHRAGYAIAAGISFEFGYACCGISLTSGANAAENNDDAAQQPAPLMRIGIYPPPTAAAQSNSIGDTRESRLQFSSSISYSDYQMRLRAIAKQLYEGDAYQINYTVPFLAALPAAFHHSAALAMYEMLSTQSGAAYRAAVTYDGGSIISLSPELFLRMRPGSLTTKPMKGTAAPGSEALLATPKNRAEHIMIVDLLRNDFARICTDVDVPALFSVERYPTYSTMTSTIHGVPRAGLGLAEIFRALFPCGSITGAPKVAALHAISRLEERPRNAYCGTIGYLLPDGTGMWNVAIRTLQFDYAQRLGRIDLGGGIVADSTAADEWAEIGVKARFLAPIADFGQAFTRA